MSLISVPATVQGIKTMGNRSLRITVDSQENLSDESLASVASLHEKYGHWCFAVEQVISPDDLLKLPPLTAREEDEKSPAVRLRNCLYRLWEQQGKKGEFEVFYHAKMSTFIEAVKERLT
jgi:hypothetical protein